MEANFKTLPECLDYFSDEEVCRQYLEHQRWGGTPACPFCGVINPYRTNRGFKCRDKQCGKKFSVTVGTVYENSKISLRLWFAVIYLCTSSKKGISSHQVGRQLGVTQKTAWFLLHRVREMLRDKAPQMLKGIVQVDETYVGGLERNKHLNKRAAKGRGESGKANDTKTPVFGIAETGGKVVVKVSDWVTKKEAQEIIKRHVEDKSTMVTDGYSMYAFLSKKNQFKHVVVDHSHGQYVNGGFHTNSIENFWSLLKRGIIGIFHQVSPWHLQRYCDEFAARFNSRKISDADRFELSIKNSNGRLKYNDLIAQGKESKGDEPDNGILIE
ncbi:MAG: IS1595 family transposase [Bacteroidetes bacterium]|nr:IS1595 family transposase [Bacteroidota bacterium]